MDDDPPRKSSTTLSNHPHLKLLRLSHAAIHQARAARDHHAPTIYYVNPPAPPPLPASSMADPSAQLQGAEARGSPRRVLFSLSSLVFLPPLRLNAREASGTSPREAGWPDSQSVISLSQDTEILANLLLTRGLALPLRQLFIFLYLLGPLPTRNL